MLNAQIRRLLDAYPAIYLACHRRHIRDDETGALVTAHQASVLDHLDIRTPMTLSNLAKHLGVGRSAMSIQVNRLVRRGYVQRRAVRGDGRKVGLTLTDAGNRVKSQNSVLDPGLIKEMFVSMPKLELESGLEGIERLAKYARLLTSQRTKRRNA